MFGVFHECAYIMCLVNNVFERWVVATLSFNQNFAHDSIATIFRILFLRWIFVSVLFCCVRIRIRFVLAQTDIVYAVFGAVVYLDLS